MTSRRVARVLPLSPLPSLDRLFDYAIPDRLDDQVRPGVRVKVPFGTRKRPLDGLVVECVPANGVESEESAPTGAARQTPDGTQFAGSISDIEKVVSPVPVLTSDVWRLARAVADRQGGVASDVLRLAIPPRHAQAEAHWRSDGGTVEAALVSAKLLDEPQRVALLVRSGGGGNPWSPGWVQAAVERVAACVAGGRKAIVCVPDFRDIHLVESALSSAIPSARVARVDSSRDAASRYRAFLEILGGAVDVVVGNRSALYAPTPDLGLIFMWDDSDPQMAEPLAPYAHARDVALLRQSQAECDLVFAAHTRSSSVERLVELGWLAEAECGELPSVVPSDLVWSDHPQRARIPDIAWRLATDALDAGGQVLIQVARRGYAGALRCAECATPAHCRSCGGQLWLGSSTDRPTCRWCSRVETSFRCTVCQGTSLQMSAPGVERTADDFGRAFPRARIVVSTGERVVEHVSTGRAVVVATAGAEPTPAEGGYAVVILLDTEAMLAREGLGVVEDALRQWLNAASLVATSGRVVACGIAGRLATALTLWRPQLIARAELAERRELGFPPALRVCTVTGPSGATGPLIEAAHLPDEVRLIGTAPWSDSTNATPGERTILAMPYAVGTAVASLLKAALMRSPQRAVRGRRASDPHELPLRFRFDDVQSL